MAEVAAMDNVTIAKRLREHARQLEIEGGNLLRVRAYRRTAQIVEELDEPLTELVEREGRRGLQSLPTIGRRIAMALEQLIRTDEIRGKRREGRETREELRV
jgi:DNA polymerase/3'-5' exonuclease PolX